MSWIRLSSKCFTTLWVTLLTNLPSRYFSYIISDWDRHDRRDDIHDRKRHRSEEDRSDRRPSKRSKLDEEDQCILSVVELISPLQAMHEDGPREEPKNRPTKGIGCRTLFFCNSGRPLWRRWRRNGRRRRCNDGCNGTSCWIQHLKRQESRRKRCGNIQSHLAENLSSIHEPKRYAKMPVLI